MKKKPDYETGYKLAVKNAEAHFATAKLLAKEINYGIATSHLVLAAEEGIKAYMIFVKHFDRTIRIDNFDKYFHKHKFKHKNIAEMMHWLGLINIIINITVSSLKDLIKMEDPTTDDFVAAKQKSVAGVIDWLRSPTKIESNEEWWMQADLLKMKGFYLDIDRNEGSWVCPTAIKKEQYEESHKIVKEFLDRIFLLEDASMDPEVLESYNKMRNRVKKIEKKTGQKKIKAG